MKKQYSISVLALLVMIVSCSNPKKELSQNDKPILVETKTVQATNQNQSIEISGTVQGVNHANLSTRLMGIVTNVQVKVGDFVKKGSLLLSIDSKDVQAQLAQAKANKLRAEAHYENVKKNYDRFENLFQKNSATQKELDDITTQLKAAKSQLEMADEAVNQVKAQLSYTDVRAPFDGVITTINIKKGNLANPGMPLLGIEENQNFEVRATISEFDIANVKAGQTVKVAIPSMDKIMEGKITELGSSSTNLGGQYQMVVSVPKAENLYSGMYAKVQIPNQQTKDSSIRIPKEVLVRKGQLTGLYTISEMNTAILRWIQLGQDLGAEVEVVAGLSVGETYVVKSDEKLFNGSKISVNQ
ncbi:MAG: efflux transporter periplasmic adaptor subunit [Flavobacteriaceae bacterium]|nr:efflux transporter periplasmic adaptor subunit [Flavobacteriaceae bacterium]|tara:strand:- start:90473 stop:91543 length:1071 start_codon:yes stop_codon:yes gene_type:complete